jgi:uncharacterized protein (TIGR00299 family) protein
LLRKELKKLQIPVYLTVKKMLKGGISGTRATVKGRGETRPHRHLNELLKIIDRSGLEPKIKSRSKTIFQRIASIEARIHGAPVEKIHFHELGGLDSVVDIVGSVWGLDRMGIDQIFVSKVNVGSGFVRCEHGLLPVPAPATLSLMEGKPIYSTETERELLTPTGAAILTSLGSQFGEMPLMKVERIGYGAGRDDLPHPNLLRLILGSPLGRSVTERVLVIETNIDDMNPQFYDYVMEKLFQLDVLDVFLTPVLMKKNRPASLLTVICPSEKLPSVTEFLIRETTTLGMRWREEERIRADRELYLLQTKHGRIHVKMAKWQGRIVNLAPEYEDCKRMSLKKKIPLKEIFEEVRKEGMKIIH